MKKIFLLLIMTQLLFFSCDKKTKGVEGESFGETHIRVLSEIERPERPQWELPSWLKTFVKSVGGFFVRVFTPIGKFLSIIFTPIGRFLSMLFSLTGVYRIIFYVIFLLLFAFIFYKIHGAFMASKKPKRIGAVSSEKAKKYQVEDSDLFLLKALEESREGNYSQAVITLHRGSVNYLHQASLIGYNRDYTNREISMIIRETPFSSPFSTIAKEAEIIRFKGIEADLETFERLEVFYRSGFLGGVS